MQPKGTKNRIFRLYLSLQLLATSLILQSILDQAGLLQGPRHLWYESLDHSAITQKCLSLLLSSLKFKGEYFILILYFITVC